MKRVDKSTPLLFQAWAQAANQGEAIFRFYRADPNTGQEQHYYTITLQNPQIVAVSTSTPNTLDPVSGALPDLQVVSFVFESITYTDEATGTEYQDTPGGP